MNQNLCRSTPSDRKPSSITDNFLTFVKAWIRNPLGVGAVWPSSQALATLMCQEASELKRAVLELGPGTGVFTRALLQRGTAPSNFFLVESSEAFVVNLRAQFPDVIVVHGQAQNLSNFDLIRDKRFDLVVSGLPLRAMPESTIEQIISSVFAHLDTEARLYQFTYGWRNPVPKWVMEKHQLQASLVGRVWRNLPPAAVYRIQRQSRQ
jgi:phosphatidylethanolamine/phosphatidyl-N-methylethanolamine N-methyltransferase